VNETLCNTCQKVITFQAKEDGTGWNRFNPDGTPHNHERKGPPARSFGRSEGEIHDIRREAVLNAAVEFAVGKLATGIPPDSIKAADVVTIAEVFHDFVMKGRPTAAAQKPAPKPAATPKAAATGTTNGAANEGRPRCAECGGSCAGGGMHGGRPLCPEHWLAARSVA
jgi:hypothetical protein